MKPALYGILAEFDAPEAVVAAAAQAHARGYRKMDAYSPFPVEGLSDAIGFRRTRLPLIVLVAGVLGCLGGFALQYYISVISYPINVGGRPLNSWPAFIPATFECTILAAATAAVLGMFALNGLPMPYHPLFNAPRFQFASRDHFFLCIESNDPEFDVNSVRNFLRETGAKDVVEVWD